MSAKLNALVMSVALMGMAAPCSAAVITFEGYADLTVFTDQDFGNGVTFAGAQILTSGGSLNPQFPPNSGVNVVYNQTGPMTLVFTSVVDFFSGYFTYNSGLSVFAYNSADTLIATAIGACSANYVGSGCGTPNEFLQVTAAGSIAKIIISGGSGNNFTLDDASFTGSLDPGVSVPEPGTLALLGLGLMGLGLSRRRKAA